MDLMSQSNQSSLASLADDSQTKRDQRIKVESKLDKQAKGYEAMLIKLEADVRQHIRVE